MDSLNQTLEQWHWRQVDHSPEGTFLKIKQPLLNKAGLTETKCLCISDKTVPTSDSFFTSVEQKEFSLHVLTAGLPRKLGVTYKGLIPYLLTNYSSKSSISSPKSALQWWVSADCRQTLIVQHHGASPRKCQRTGLRGTFTKLIICCSWFKKKQNFLKRASKGANGLHGPCQTEGLFREPRLKNFTLATTNSETLGLHDLSYNIASLFDYQKLI